MPIPQKFWTKEFPNSTVPRTDNWNPNSTNGTVSWLQTLPHENHSLEDRLDELHRVRVRIIAGLDEMVADMVSEVEGHGIQNNTHVIYTTDNCYNIEQHIILTIY